ncbi:uncharacterized protein Gasu_47590 [Galdieria sulphuraria]|uniref:Uncharacterized protein n=1 Tax=Galdieria sulphuraria TaxID=130081 RepID=M2XVU8_GALSU|nr:uncharacterized protein Gasu_47590 [Galdieria sulphuraria]EME27773.1 hypothetical protein Gasu_47590 [Galdieria sulphuraria]|eukprot:XP_005704293.1 hypothetical protein Gasu_47590 [Galdieria sulphuraria]
MLQNLREEDLESFAIDDLIRFIRCKCSSLENNEFMERTLELLPPGETWNRNTWENVTTVLDEWVYSLRCSKEPECTSRLVGNDRLEEFVSGEEAFDSWAKVLKCKLCFRLVSVESFGNHLIVFHSSSVQNCDGVQQYNETDTSLEKEVISNKERKLSLNVYRNICSPLSPFFYGDDEDVAQLRQKDKERRRHLECRVLQYPQNRRKRRRSQSEDISTFSSKSKLQKDKKSSNNDSLNARKEGSVQETDDLLASLMNICTSYVAGMHDLNKVQQDRAFLKEFPNHVDLSQERVQNERHFENALQLLAKKRNFEGNNIERQRRLRDAIYLNGKDVRNNSFLTESGSLLVSKGEAELAVASAVFRSKMNAVRMDNGSPDVSTLRNGNMSWNNAYYPRATSSAAPRLSRPSQENRLGPVAQANILDTKYSGLAPTGKTEVENNALMEGNNIQHMKSEMQNHSSHSKLPIAAPSQTAFSLSSPYSRRFVSSKGLPNSIPNHNMTHNSSSLSPEQLQQVTMQSSSLGGSKMKYPAQHVNSPSMKSGDSKGKRKSTKSVEKGKSLGEQTKIFSNLSEQQRETVNKSNTEVIAKEKFEGMEWNINAMNMLRSTSDPSSMTMFTSKSPRILSNAGMNASQDAAFAFPENVGQRQAQFASNKQLNDLVGFVERKLNNNRSQQYVTERSGISNPYHSGTASFGDDPGRKDYQENATSYYSPLEIWKQVDKCSVPKYGAGFEGLREEQSMKRENVLPNNYNTLWKDHMSSVNFPFQRGQLSHNNSKLISRSSSNKSNHTYEEDYLNSSWGDNEGLFSPKSFGMDRSAVKHEYNLNGIQPNYMEQSPMRELSESSIDAYHSGMEVASDIQGQKASSFNVGNVQSNNSFLSTDSGGLMPDSAATSYRPLVNKPGQNIDNHYSRELSKTVGPRNGQVPLRNVTFGSFGLNTLSATSLQRGGFSHSRQSGQQTSEETYGILQNLRGGGSQSLSSLMASSDTTVSSRKVNLPNLSERIDAKQLHRLNSPTVVSSTRLDNHSPSIDNRLTLSTGNLRRKEYRVRTNIHEDTNFGTNSEDITRNHR